MILLNLSVMSTAGSSSLTFRAERAEHNANVQIALAKRDASIRVTKANARGRRFEVEGRTLRRLAIVQEIDAGARL